MTKTSISHEEHVQSEPNHEETHNEEQGVWGNEGCGSENCII